MKKIIFSILLILGTVYFANGEIIGPSKYSYNKVSNNYTFYILTYASIGYGSNCMDIGLVQFKKSNDTIYINVFYDLRPAFSLVGGYDYDSVKYTNTHTGINYFTVTTNYFDNPGTPPEDDTTRNLYDTTFYVGTSIIKEQNVVKVLSIYPNPTNTAISLPIAANELLVYNTYGQVVLQAKDIAAQQSIPVSQLNSGLYFVAVFDTEKNKVGVGKFYKE